MMYELAPKCPTCRQPWLKRVAPTRLRPTRLLIAEDLWGGHRQFYITDAWTIEQAKAYAAELGMKPLCIINVKDKRNG